MNDLRDYTFSTWSRPVKSKKLDKLFQADRQAAIITARAPKLHSSHDVHVKAVQNEEERRLISLCQKRSFERTEEEVAFIHAYATALCPFLRLWPEALQHELARVLRTEVLVQKESVMARGMQPTKLYIILSGKLDVVAPAAAMEGGQEGGMRVMASLKSGDTCGEAVLLGQAVAHADVLVSSKSAVLLSLAFTDFLRTFKEVMGLKQQDRLVYLRMHPLFTGISLGDLDCLAEALHRAFYPAGTLLLPSKHGEPHKWFLLAEGAAAVKRLRATTAARLHSYGDHNSQLAYDSDTVSLLQPLDVIGGKHLPPNHVVETTSAVRAYWIAADQLAGLPPRLQELLEGTQAFKSQYFAGRLEGLGQLDQARRRPTYGAYQYKVGEVTMTALGAVSSLPSPTGHPGRGEGRERGGAGGSTVTIKAIPNLVFPAAPPPATNKEQLMQALGAAQVVAALDARPVRDRHTGLPPLPPSPERHAHMQDAASIFLTHLNMPAANPKPTSARPRSPWDHGPPDHTHDSHEVGGGCALGKMPPHVKAFPKVEPSKREEVVTEVPISQPIPWTLKQRHNAIFERARQAATMRPPTRDPYGYLRDSDEDDDELPSGPGAGSAARQPSRRLSGDLRSREGQRAAQQRMRQSAGRAASAHRRHSSGGGAGGANGNVQTLVLGIPYGGMGEDGGMDYRLSAGSVSSTGSQPNGSSLTTFYMGGQGLADGLASPRMMQGGQPQPQRAQLQQLQEEREGMYGGLGDAGGWDLQTESGGFFEPLGLGANEGGAGQQLQQQRRQAVPGSGTSQGSSGQQQGSGSANGKREGKDAPKPGQQPNAAHAHHIAEEHAALDLAAPGAMMRTHRRGQSGAAPGAQQQPQGQGQGELTAAPTPPASGGAKSRPAPLRLPDDPVTAPTPLPPPQHPGVQLPPAVALGYEALNPFEMILNVLPKPKW